MKTEGELYQLIDQYLQGKLPPDHPFLKDLAQDASLQEEVELQQLVTNAVIDNRLLKVQAEVNSLRSIPRPAPKRNYLAKTLVALVVCAGVAYLVLNKFRQPEVIATNKVAISPSPSPVPLSKTERKEPSPIVPSSQKPIKSILPKMEEAQGNAPSAVQLEPAAPVQIAETPKTVEVVLPEKLEEKKAIVPLESKATAPLLKKAEIETKTQEPETKTKPTMESHVFEPNRETWEVPTNMEKSGKLSIFDKNGLSVYKREFGKMEKITWDGTALTGGMLASTMYVYLIEYTDGSTQQGTVTLSY